MAAAACFVKLTLIGAYLAGAPPAEKPITRDVLVNRGLLFIAIPVEGGPAHSTFGRARTSLSSTSKGPYYVAETIEELMAKPCEPPPPGD